MASLDTSPARPHGMAGAHVRSLAARARVCVRGRKPGWGYAHAFWCQAADAARAEGGGVSRGRRRCAGEGAHSGAAPRIELEVGGICVQADAFAAGGPHARRLAVSVHHAELRDCQVRRALRRWEAQGAWRGEGACVVSGDAAGSPMPCQESAELPAAIGCCECGDRVIWSG